MSADAINDTYRRYSEPCEIYYMAGQSNMAGRDVDGTNLTTRTNDAEIYEYNRDSGALRSFATIYPDGGPTVNFGPNVGSMRTRFNNTSNNIFVIRYAVGGQSIAAFLPESDRLMVPVTDLPPSNSDYSTLMIDFMNENLNRIYRRDFNYPVKTRLIWYQGSEDSKYTGEQAYTQNLSSMYETHLENLFAYFRSNLTEFSGKFTVVRSPDWQSGPGGPTVKPGQDVVRAAQVSVSEADPNANWITSDINQGVTTTWEDASHIDAASQERLGIDLAAII